jgi:hypothetical protein
MEHSSSRQLFLVLAQTRSERFPPGAKTFPTQSKFYYARLLTDSGVIVERNPTAIGKSPTAAGLLTFRFWCWRRTSGYRAGADTVL